MKTVHIDSLISALVKLAEGLCQKEIDRPSYGDSDSRLQLAAAVGAVQLACDIKMSYLAAEAATKHMHDAREALDSMWAPIAKLLKDANIEVSIMTNEDDDNDKEGEINGNGGITIN